MASGLQCPGCGHVHPAGLPEIARGDATFRCYGCYRMLSVPDGWSGRPSTRQSAPGAAPAAGPGTRDARSARLAGRRRGALTRSAPEAPAAGPPTQMVPSVAPDEGMVGPGDVHTGWPASGGRAAAALSGSGVAADAVGTTTVRSPRPEAPGRAAPADGVAPRGWVSRRPATGVSKPIRVLVWVLAFGIGLAIAAVVLRKIGVLDVNRVLDLYAGSGLGRFGVLLVLLPLWALLSATIAHFSLEGLAARRRPRPAPSPRRPPADTPSP